MRNPICLTKHERHTDIMFELYLGTYNGMCFIYIIYSIEQSSSITYYKNMNIWCIPRLDLLDFRKAYLFACIVLYIIIDLPTE